MIRITKWIAARVAPQYEKTDNLDARTRIGLTEGWVSIVVNTALTAVKVCLWLVTGSVALLADAFHTFSDSGTSVIVVFGFRIARKPPDRQHPFGHGRVESIAGVVIAVLLGVIAIEMGRASVDRILHPQTVVVKAWVIAVILVALVVKEVLAQFSFDLGKLIGSDALLADGWHHRSDVFATGLVVVAFAGSYWGIPWLDGTMGVAVAIIIALAAAVTLKHAVGPLLGEYASEGTYRAIMEIARSVGGVKDVHDIVVHRYGSMNIISLHIEVADKASPLALHELSTQVEDKVASRFPGHTIVHIDPIDRDHENYSRVERLLNTMIQESGRFSSYHDLRITGAGRNMRVVLDLAFSPGSPEQERQQYARQVAKQIGERFPGATVEVNVEPAYLRSFDNPSEKESPR